MEESPDIPVWVIEMVVLLGLLAVQANQWVTHHSPDHLITFKLPPSWQVFGVDKVALESIDRISTLGNEVRSGIDFISNPSLKMFELDYKLQLIALDASEKARANSQFDSLTVFSRPTSGQGPNRFSPPNLLT